jgi:hypothetical protein
MKDGFIGFGDADASVPPGLSGRRVQVVASLAEVRVFLEGELVARHLRSVVPAEVVLDPAHARALRLPLEPPRDAWLPVTWWWLCLTCPTTTRRWACHDEAGV